MHVDLHHLATGPVARVGDGHLDLDLCRAHDRRDRVRCVVVRVYVVEEQRCDDHQGEGEEGGVLGGPLAFLMTTERSSIS